MHAIEPDISIKGCALHQNSFTLCATTGSHLQNSTHKKFLSHINNQYYHAYHVYDPRTTLDSFMRLFYSAENCETLLRASIIIQRAFLTKPISADAYAPPLTSERILTFTYLPVILFSKINRLLFLSFFNLDTISGFALKLSGELDT